MKTASAHVNPRAIRAALAASLTLLSSPGTFDDDRTDGVYQFCVDESLRLRDLARVKFASQPQREIAEQPEPLLGVRDTTRSTAVGLQEAPLAVDVLTVLNAHQTM